MLALEQNIYRHYDQADDILKNGLEINWQYFFISIFLNGNF